MTRSSFLVASKLSTVTLQLLLKRDFSKYLEELLFGTYHACVGVLDRVAKPWSFYYFFKKWFHHRRSQIKFKILETNNKKIYGRISFRIAVSGWIGQLHFFKRNTTKDVFLLIFQSFLNCSFSNIPSTFFLEPFS